VHTTGRLGTVVLTNHPVKLYYTISNTQQPISTGRALFAFL